MATPWDRRPHRKGECRAGGRHQWRAAHPDPRYPDAVNDHVIKFDHCIKTEGNKNKELKSFKQNK